MTQQVARPAHRHGDRRVGEPQAALGWTVLIKIGLVSAVVVSLCAARPMSRTASGAHRRLFGGLAHVRSHKPSVPHNRPGYVPNRRARYPRTPARSAAAPDSIRLRLSFSNAPCPIEGYQDGPTRPGAMGSPLSRRIGSAPRSWLRSGWVRDHSPRPWRPGQPGRTGPSSNGSGRNSPALRRASWAATASSTTSTRRGPCGTIRYLAASPFGSWTTLEQLRSRWLQGWEGGTILILPDEVNRRAKRQTRRKAGTQSQRDPTPGRPGYRTQQGAQQA